VLLTTDQKGNIAETTIVAAAVKLGIDVYRPVGEGGRYDMIFEINERLLRDPMQVGSASSRRGRAALLLSAPEP
jgi:hypothetical protein